MNKFEYACPKCGHLNFIDEDHTKDKYKEHLLHCSSCNQLLEMMVADGLNKEINLIVTAAIEVDR